jgi:hypothetical protein
MSPIRLSYVSFHRALLAASCGLFLSCLLLLGLEYFPAAALLSRIPDFRPFLWAVLPLAGLAAIVASRWLILFLCRWGRWTELIWLDLTAGTATYALGIALLDGRLTPPRNAIVLILGSALFALAAVRIVIALRQLGTTIESVPLFDRVLGPGGLAPLEDFEHDALGRATFVTALEELIGHPRQVSLNFGVEGIWGSGKTTLLLELRKRLHQKRATTIWLDTWSFREPERLLNAYFGELRDAIGKSLLTPRLASQLRGLIGRLAPLAGSRLGETISRMFTPADQHNLETSRHSLELLLKHSRAPIVVFLDDLDRIDGPELQTVLRAVRLVSDLPNLTHVLAYDRTRLARLLFPKDATGALARDFLGKVINVELSLPPPPRNLAFDLIDKSLLPFLEGLPRNAAEDFALRLREISPTLLMEVLPTPREIRRVAAATAWIYRQMQRHLNAFDLFVLSAIQYRYPWLYDRIRNHPSEFAFAEWSFDLTARGPAFGEEIGTTEQLRNRRKQRRSEIALPDDRESVTAMRLAELIFPLETYISEAEARRGRRALHPAVLPRYYQLYIQPGAISELEMEEFADTVLSAPTSEARQSILAQRLTMEAGQGRVHQFFSQWYLVFGAVFLPKQPPGLPSDLVLGLTRAASALPADADVFVRSARGLAASTAVGTVLAVEAISRGRIVVEAVEAADNLPLSDILHRRH